MKMYIYWEGNIITKDEYKQLVCYIRKNDSLCPYYANPKLGQKPLANSIEISYRTYGWSELSSYKDNPENIDTYEDATELAKRAIKQWAEFLEENHLL